MASIWTQINSPRNLVIFAAAAKHGSFTRAATELNMQQPSVSAAIKQLEDALNVSLFVRSHRKVELTTAGNRLFSDVSRSLDDIERSIESVRQMGREDHVTLNSSSAFSHYWMVPRLQKLHDKHPDIDLRLQTSDREPNLDMENISLGIRLGNGKWPGCHAAKIADEVIFPVASPQVMASARNLRSIPNLMNERLIHLEEPVRERPTWSDWFAHHGIEDRHVIAGLRLNDYALVLQAAMSGEGFAFGWEHVVRDLIRRNLLAGRPEWSWRTGKSFYLVWSTSKPLAQHAALVRDWIISVSDFPLQPKEPQ
ncbi:LysR substrate-binding domain-containing protein [Shimia haliotis]|uniref:Transcriptional regulator n=1 Tax=Shimia haliotis TaxID=1280847 RepID=A0A1I4CYD2_9RHOB|nr:LysR substrate-binding domain-containing protein [Shimia haliotis]SFK85783.1 transcriptional regulator [Shimia haliotis]